MTDEEKGKIIPVDRKSRPEFFYANEIQVQLTYISEMIDRAELYEHITEDQGKELYNKLAQIRKEVNEVLS